MYHTPASASQVLKQLQTQASMIVVIQFSRKQINEKFECVLLWTEVVFTMHTKDYLCTNCLKSGCFFFFLYFPWLTRAYKTQ